MISEVLTVFVQIDATPVGLEFDFRFHDGYQKKITVKKKSRNNILLFLLIDLLVGFEAITNIIAKKLLHGLQNVK